MSNVVVATLVPEPITKSTFVVQGLPLSKRASIQKDTTQDQQGNNSQDEFN